MENGEWKLESVVRNNSQVQTTWGNSMLHLHFNLITGKQNIICVEDMIHEVFTVGDNFKYASNALWPFKVSPFNLLHKIKYLCYSSFWEPFHNYLQLQQLQWLFTTILVIKFLCPNCEHLILLGTYKITVKWSPYFVCFSPSINGRFRMPNLT